MNCSIAARPSSYKKHGENCLIARVRRKIKYVRVRVRAKVEYLFRMIKRQFGYAKLLFRRLAINTAQLATLFDLSNLQVVRTQLLVGNPGVDGTAPASTTGLLT
jgi:IS5 family transposase